MGGDRFTGHDEVPIDERAGHHRAGFLIMNRSMLLEYAHHLIDHPTRLLPDDRWETVAAFICGAGRSRFPGDDHFDIHDYERYVKKMTGQPDNHVWWNAYKRLAVSLFPEPADRNDFIRRMLVRALIDYLKGLEEGPAARR
jgi:hypothetical protein